MSEGERLLGRFRFR